MLNKILELISSQRISTVNELVKITKQDASLVQAQIDILKEKGLIQCETLEKPSCSACSLKNNCKIK